MFNTASAFGPGWVWAAPGRVQGAVVGGLGCFSTQMSMLSDAFQPLSVNANSTLVGQKAVAVDHHGHLMVDSLMLHAYRALPTQEEVSASTLSEQDLMAIYQDPDFRKRFPSFQPSESVKLPHTIPVVQLKTASGDTIELTADHFLPVGPACCDYSSLRAAGDVNVGDLLWVASHDVTTRSHDLPDLVKNSKQVVSSPVVNIALVMRPAVFNAYAHQPKRNLIINGVVASSFAGHATSQLHGFEDFDQSFNVVRRIFEASPNAVQELSGQENILLEAMTLQLYDIVLMCVANDAATDSKCTSQAISQQVKEIVAQFTKVMSDSTIAALTLGLNRMISSLFEHEKQKMVDFVSANGASADTLTRLQQAQLQSTDDLVAMGVLQVQAAVQEHKNRHGQGFSTASIAGIAAGCAAAALVVALSAWMYVRRRRRRRHQSQNQTGAE